MVVWSVGSKKHQVLMLIKIKNNSEPKSSEISSESAVWRRRSFIKSLGLGAAIACGSVGRADDDVPSHKFDTPEWLKAQCADLQRQDYALGEQLTEWRYATSFNNFYEFGFDKRDPKRYARNYQTFPWRLKIDGEVFAEQNIFLEDLLKDHELEERVYRFRCVEAWSMVVPWVGIPLRKVIARAKVKMSAKYLLLQTAVDQEQMPFIDSSLAIIPFPYQEGLRLDEAMHPLSMLVVGMYGKSLPGQNGAPMRLIVPWKYGFKSIKSVNRISFTEVQPQTSWNNYAAREYGFYANVNPKVDHPRWSQATETRIPSSMFFRNEIATQMFNGYEQEVASLYSGMDLRKFY